MSVEPVAPRPLCWSEVPILFSHDNQWTSFSKPDKFPLVLDPVVAEVRLTKVLIDGGSGLNLIFGSTLRKMDMDFTDMLVPSKSPFYGIAQRITLGYRAFIKSSTRRRVVYSRRRIKSRLRLSPHSGLTPTKLYLSV
jgi:hypothetical protein